MQVNVGSLYEAEQRPTYRIIRQYILEKYGIKAFPIDIACVKEKYGLIERTHWVENPRFERCPPEKETPIIEALKHFGIIPDEEG